MMGLRTTTGLSYADGGNYVTLGLSHLGIESLADPNDNQLVGWDDTDGAMKFIDLGTGLSYDHATHTLSGGGVQDIGAAVTHDATQAISTGANIALAFNTERWDTNAIHDNVTNNSRLTCKTAGKYTINGCFSFAANATGYRQGSIRLNGTTLISISGFGAPPSPYEPRVALSCTYNLAVNDYVELMAFQDSGGNLNVQQAGNYTPEFRMQLLN